MTKLQSTYQKQLWVAGNTYQLDVELPHHFHLEIDDIPMARVSERDYKSYLNSDLDK